MTRRLEPMDRVRELGDASVPFRFDVHALVFSDDAVGLENRLHTALADRRVNKVNIQREFFRATPAQVRDLLAAAAGSHLLEFTETVEALEWRGSGADTTAAAPPPPAPVLHPHPSEDASLDNPDDHAEPPVRGTTAASALRQLQPDQTVPLSPATLLRLQLAGPDDSSDDVEIDPVAFLLTRHGLVSGDDDMVFYGQPDHPSGAVRLAADESGAPTALDIRTDLLPSDINEILLTAHTTADSRLHLDATDAEHGPIGRLLLPPPGPGGLVQIGALHRSTDDRAQWHLSLQPDAISHDLAGLATAAEVDIA